MADPDWYESLPKLQKNQIDQGLHWIIALVSSFGVKALLIPIPAIGIAVSAVVVLMRELVFSGKIERVGDTVEDSRVWMTGAVLGDLIAAVYMPMWWTI